MLGETHVVHIGLFRTSIVQQDGIVPETETIDTVVTLCHTEERLSVVAFDTGYQIILAV